MPTNIFFVAKGTGGDLVPFPTIGEKLKERGFKVTLFSHISYAEMAAQNGWDFVALDTLEERQQIINDGQLLNSPSGYPTYFRRHVLPRAVAEYEAIHQRYIPGETVLVTTHKACLVPLLAAEKLGIPLVRLFATVSELVTLPLMEEMYRAVLGDELNSIRGRIGLPPLKEWNAWLRKADRELALWPDWFAAPDDAWAVKALPVGFIQETGGEISKEIIQALKEGEKPILITAGTGLFTDPKFYAASAEACHRLDRRGLLVTRYPHLVPNPLPKQVRHFEYAPFASLMPHVSAVVHHGGVGSLACALASGVPQLVLASGGDRPENGQRIQNLGVGEYLLSSRWDAETIASALDRLLNSSTIQKNCQAFATRLHAADAAAEVCNQIERILPSRSQKKPNFINQDNATYPLPLIPVLMFNYAHRAPQAWWRVLEMLVEVPRILGPAQLKEVARCLIAHHDGLRLRLVKENSDYRMFIAPSEDNAFVERDLSDLPELEQNVAIGKAIEEQWASLSFETGPLFRMVFFDLGPQRLPQMLIILHHFAADAYSVGVLLSDFQTACRQLLAREAIQLPPKTTSISEWAERLYAHVQSDAANAEYAYWKSKPWANVQPSPVDHPEVTHSLSATMSGWLNADETQLLLNKIPTIYHIQALDVLLTACVLTYARYSRLKLFTVYILNHGRNLTLGGTDLLRTVGNVYAPYTLFFDTEMGLDLDRPEKALKLVAEHRAQVPNDGAVWPWISYYSNDHFLTWKNQKKVNNIVFNYTGRVKSDAQTQTGFFREVQKENQETIAHLYDVTEMPPHTCAVSIEGDRLKVTWEYFSALDEQVTIEKLIQEFLAILRTFIQSSSVSVESTNGASSIATAPSTNTLDPKTAMAQRFGKLSPEKQALLEQRLREKRAKNSEQRAILRQPRQPGVNTFPLSFAQQRLWFLDQLTPGNAAYNIFTPARLHGPLDIAAVEQGFKQVTQRHESLRTTFQSLDGQPCQAIHPSMDISLPMIDLSALPEAEQQAEAQRLAFEEAQRPFDLSSGPLVRCTFLRLGETEHIIILTMHHTISDGWSLNIFFREIVLLGQAYAAGQEARLPALPLQYADFAVWQREWLQGETLQAQLAYWKEQLADAPAALELPTDHPRPAVQTHRGITQGFHFSPALTQALHAFSQREGVTLFITLLTAFQTLLARYSGQTDILVGSPYANRNRVEFEGMIGFFANTLVLRTNLSGDPNFREALRRVRAVVAGAHSHPDLPFEKLVDELQISRDLSRNPLFQVMFIFLNTPGAAVTLHDLTLEAFGEVDTSAQFDLTLSVYETRRGLTGTLVYNADLFEAETITPMLGHFEALAQTMVDDPEQPISEAQFLTAAERGQILSAWNATESEYPWDKPVYELFEAQVEKTPDAVALIFDPNIPGAGEQTLTYRELNERANELAHYLRKQGVGPDVLIAICVERSLEMVVGVLGILKSGGAYVPLDPTYPKERLAYMLEDSRSPILLTQEHLIPDLPEHHARVIRLDADWETIAAEERANPAHIGDPDHLAYVIYTSGSTGRPKGVQIRQSGLVNFLIAMRHRPGLNAQDRLLSVTTLSFDIAGLELYLPLIVGAQVEVVSREVAADGFRLRERLESGSITMLQATPATWRLLLDAGWKGTKRLKALVGGEALSPALATSLLMRSRSLWNMYGPTETTVWSTLARIEIAGGNSPIGSPIANTQVYVLDKRFNPVPVGVPGELYIGGDGLARGYLNRPELTAERFVPNPFAAPATPEDEGRRKVESLGPPSSDLRLYRTGDLVRYLPDGNLEFLGRIDHQVKVRGHRIELGEIESALGEHADVRESVAIVREDSPGDRRLVAYIVPRPQTDLTVSALRNTLKAKLPDYMLPSAFVLLDEFPLTPNGKIDRKALPMPDGGRPALGAEWVAPRTPTEEQLARIWTSVLRLKRVGVYDDFFESGGDSLLSLQVISHARQAGIHLTPRQIFQHHTIAELAAEADATPETQAQEGIAIGSVPLTPDQRRFFGRSLASPEHWLVVLETEVLFPLRPDLLKQAAQILFEHHDALRTRFVREAGGWQQRIAKPDENTPFTYVNLSKLPPVEQDSAMQATAVELRNGLNLAKGPLVQTVYFDLGTERPGHFLLIMHLLVSDAYSLQVLAKDFQTTYQQLVQGEAVQLTPKTTSYKEWAEKLSAHARSSDLLQELDYWINLPWDHIAYPPLDMPNEAENTIASICTQTLALSKDETDALFKIYPADLQNVLLTALGQTLAYWTESHYALFILIINGREAIFEDVDLSRTVGRFALGHPVLLDMTNAHTPVEALASVKEQLARIPNRGITHGVLHLIEDDEVQAKVKELDEVSYRDKVIFNYAPPLVSNFSSAELFRPIQQTIDLSENPDKKRNCILQCTANIFDEQLSFAWEYSSNLHRPETIEAIAHFHLDAVRALLY